MSAFQIIYTVIGGLGIFFYGMKMMSDALQATAGDAIRRIINSLTSNPILAVLVGTGITMIVQSSSVTTVMVVGLVNAGLMHLTQAVGVILGANIGTTITGWIISIKIGKYGLLLVGLGIFPALFAKRDSWKELGKVIFGVGLIFMGLETMSHALKPLAHDQAFLDSISFFSGQHYGAYIASALVGAALTGIIQSSSAMLGVTIALATTGVVTHQTALALVLGANIGTTITAVLAAVGTGINARRAAIAHALFNILGSIIALAIFPIYAHFIEIIDPSDPTFRNAAGDFPYAAVYVATGHTFFNIAMTVLFVPFIKPFSNLVIKLVPEKGAVADESKKFVLVGNKSDVLPATAILQAEGECKKFGDVVGRMFNLAYDYIMDEKKDTHNLAKIKSYETITDKIEKDITLFISKVMQKELSPNQSVDAQVIVRLADEFESCADYIEKLALTETRFSKEGIWNEEAKEDFELVLRKVKEFYFIVLHMIEDMDSFDHNLVLKRRDEIKILANNVRDRHMKRMGNNMYEPIETALTYSDMIVDLRKIAAHTSNLAQAISRTGDE